MKLQMNRKSSDYIHNAVYRKMNMLQPSGFHIENIYIFTQKPRNQNNLFTVTQQDFCSGIENSI